MHRPGAATGRATVAASVGMPGRCSSVAIAATSQQKRCRAPRRCIGHAAGTAFAVLTCRFDRSHTAVDTWRTRAEKNVGHPGVRPARHRSRTRAGRLEPHIDRLTPVHTNAVPPSARTDAHLPNVSRAEVGSSPIAGDAATLRADAPVGAVGGRSLARSSGSGTVIDPRL